MIFRLKIKSFFSRRPQTEKWKLCMKCPSKRFRGERLTNIENMGHWFNFRPGTPVLVSTNMAVVKPQQSLELPVCVFTSLNIYSQSVCPVCSHSQLWAICRTVLSPPLPLWKTWWRCCMEEKGLKTMQMKFGLTFSLATCKSVTFLLAAREIKITPWLFLVSIHLSSLHRAVANDRYSLWKLGITHVVNAAHGRMHCQGSHDFYGSTVDYYGVPADDSPSFDLSRYFFPSAEYIQSALDTAGGKYPSRCFIVTQTVQASLHATHPIQSKISVSAHAF